MKRSGFPDFIDDFAQRHPHLTTGVIASLLLFIVAVELLSTEAPVVLYQAF